MTTYSDSFGNPEINMKRKLRTKYIVVSALDVKVSSGVRLAKRMSACSVGRNLDKMDLFVDVEEPDELLLPV